MLGPTLVKKKSYANKEGAWSETNPKEIMNFIALLIYQGSVKVSSHAPYWSTKSLYHGLWAGKFMSRNRYAALLGMLHGVDYTGKGQTNKLHKVDSFIEHFCSKCI